MNDELNQRVTAAFQFGVETLVGFLDMRHGEAKEFKSVRAPVLLKHPNTGEQIETDRWADPPEKLAYMRTLRATLEEFVREGCADAADELFRPIIAEYYSVSRAKNPVKGKIKEPVKDRP